MSDYNTATQEMRSTKDLANTVASLISQHTKADREFYITNWIDTLIEVGRVSSVNQATKFIAEIAKTTPQAIAHYYKGKN